MTKHGGRHHGLSLFAVPTLWLAAWWIIDPSGEFPLNDDWAYTLPVEWLLSEGDLRLTDWGAMSLVSHVAWGAVFSQLLGFSFLTLRMSTMVAGFLGLVAFGAVLRELGVGLHTRLLAVAVLGFNPIYFELSHTFMTDVPFLALFLASVLLWLQWARSGARLELAGALVLAVVATLTRQVGIAIGLGLAAATLVQGRGSRTVWAAAAALLLTPILTYLAYTALVDLPETQGDALGQFALIFERSPLESAKIYGYRGLWRGLGAWAYLGLFALPLSLGALRSLTREGWWRVTLLGVIVAAILLSAGRTLPHLGDAFPPGNILIRSGVGPATLEVIPGIVPHALPQAMWTGATVAGAFGGALLIEVLLYGLGLVSGSGAVRSWRGNAVGAALVTLFGVVSIVYIAPFFLTWIFFDRYLLLLLSVALAVSAYVLQDGSVVRFNALRGLQLLILLGFAGYGVLGTHDYLSWNRVRWQMLSELTGRAGISAADVRGGFEFDMWHAYRSREESSSEKLEAEWRIAFEALPEYTVRSRRSYSRWMPGGLGQLYLLQRKSEG